MEDSLLCQSITTLLMPKEKAECSVIKRGRDPCTIRQSGECATLLAGVCESLEEEEEGYAGEERERAAEYLRSQ